MQDESYRRLALLQLLFDRAVCQGKQGSRRRAVEGILCVFACMDVVTGAPKNCIEQ